MLSEIKDMEDQDDIQYHANMNGYLLMSGKITIEDLLGESLISENYCTFDPHIKMPRHQFKRIVEDMITYFIEQEDYEKCTFFRDYTYESYLINLGTQQW